MQLRILHSTTEYDQRHIVLASYSIDKLYSVHVSHMLRNVQLIAIPWTFHGQY